MTRKTTHTLQDWQLDPNRITSETVQYWRNGVMLTAQMRRAEARERVRTGLAFVMTSQAIGALVNGQPWS